MNYGLFVNQTFDQILWDHPNLHNAVKAQVNKYLVSAI